MIFKNILNGNSKPIKILIGIVIVSVLFISYGVWTHLRSGSIDVYIEKRGATIFLDKKKVGTSNADDQTITLKRVGSGEHSVLVYMKGYYPWEKTIRVKTGAVTPARSFFVMKDITPSYIKTKFTNAERSNLEKKFSKPTEGRKISFFGEGNVEIRKEKNKIFATWLGDTSSLPDFFCNNIECKNSLLVFSSDKQSIGMLDFYPGRDDVVLFSLDKNIYAIEIDKKSNQNFQPVYTGTSPVFTIEKQSSMVYVKDGDVLFGIAL